MKKQLSQNSFQITLLSKLSTSLKILKIGFNNTVMVGSAKLGMSLSPEKFLKHFTDEGDNQSDIDSGSVLFHF